MNYSSTLPSEAKPCLWDKRYVIENLPAWIYTDNEQPNTQSECKAKLSSLKYTIEDMVERFASGVMKALENT